VERISTYSTEQEECQKNSSEIFQMLITSDLSDSFPQLSFIAQAIISCPVGTADM